MASKKPTSVAQQRQRTLRRRQQRATPAPRAPRNRPPDGIAGLVLKPSAWLFLMCLCAYLANGTFVPGRDQEANMVTSLNLLKNGSFSMTPSQAPRAFSWVLHQPGQAPQPLQKVHHLSAKALDLYASGALRPQQRYYLTESTRSGHYVSAFGPGAALLAVPLYGFLDAFTDLSANSAVWWFGAKTLAAVLVAFSVVLIFMSMGLFVATRPALFGALVFGLGSTAWSLGSQALLQQTAALFFLALGAWFLLGSAAGRGKNFALYCGAAFGMAVACRPTGVFAALFVGLYFLAMARRGGFSPVLKYALGLLPFAVAVGMYNDYYLGSPFTFAQSVVAEYLAQQSAGGDIWNTPLLVGLSGLLFSPSRGLLFYSPLLLAGFAGAVLLWRQPRKFAALIPLLAAAVAMLLTAALWFDWWGGNTYGPRPLVDLGVFLVLLMIPLLDRAVLDKILAARWLGGACAALLLYSCAVQGLGAWTYNGQWNVVDQRDPGQLQHRGRFWALSDSQIWYYASHFQAAIKHKRLLMDTVTR